ncbi:MAG: HIT domain-containing protein [Bacteroidota bacterium]
MVEDTILFETDNYYVKPALGQFVEGYLLIVSKSHIPSISHLSENQFTELMNVVTHLKQFMIDVYKGSVTIFEHGIVNHSYNAGCCIDHAHLHMLPFDYDLHEIISKEFPYAKINSIIDLKQHLVDGMSYLYYHNCYGVDYTYYISKHIESQYMRRKICERLNISDEYDWAVFPFRNKIKILIKKYHAYFQSKLIDRDESTPEVSD